MLSPALLAILAFDSSQQSHVDPAFAVAFVQSISAIALFSFLSVATWVGGRKTEREAYYKAEMMKKIAEVGGEQNPALEYLREQERIDAAKQLGGIKLGGLVVSGVGLGGLIFLKALLPAQPIYLCGTIILFVGLALLAYAFWLAPGRSAVR